MKRSDAIALLMTLPEDSRRWALWLADLELQIAEQADYILKPAIKHPVNDLRAARRAVELARARRSVIELHPELTQEVMTAAHEANALPPPL